MMKMTYGTGWSAVSCQINADINLRVENRLAGFLDADTVRYAVCRFFTKTPSLCRTYAWESYQLRLARGKGRRPHRHCCAIPAPLMELPAGWVQVRFQVDPVGVSIRQIVLTPEYPGSERRQA